MADQAIPGPDLGACPECGGWRKAGMVHRCTICAALHLGWDDENRPIAPGPVRAVVADRCDTCGVSKQQVLGTFNGQQAALRSLIRRAAPFVNAVAVMAGDKAPALAWLADASDALLEQSAEQEGC